MTIDLQEVSRTLFAAADKMWTNTELRPNEYSQPVLALIALRQMETKFEAVHAELAPMFKGRLKAAPTDYRGRGAVFLPETARFSRLLALPESADLGAELNEAIRLIVENNPDLGSALPRGFVGMPNATLRELLRLLAPLKLEGDAYGLIFEYFMGQFAANYMQKGGEFFTPASIVKLIVEVIEPYHGTIFDPACGSGGMFVHSAEFVRRHHKQPAKEISIYGTEKMSDTLRLCRLNLAVHGLSGDIRSANAYYDDPYKLIGKFDFVMANPPFNQSEVDLKRLIKDTGKSAMSDVEMKRLIVDTSKIDPRIEALLDEKIEGVAITAPIVKGDGVGDRVDLSGIDFEKLAGLFKSKPKTANEQLRAKAEKKARDMAGENPTRKDLVDKLEALVAEYNSGTIDAAKFFEALKNFVEEMEEEERRAAREGLTERELAVFDLLTRPSPKLTKAQEIEVKRVAKELLQKLQAEHLVARWEENPQTRAAVQSEIRFKLNELPEESYPETIWTKKVDAVWQFIYQHLGIGSGGARPL